MHGPPSSQLIPLQLTCYEAHTRQCSPSASLLPGWFRRGSRGIVSSKIREGRRPRRRERSTQQRRSQRSSCMTCAAWSSAGPWHRPNRSLHSNSIFLCVTRTRDGRRCVARKAALADMIKTRMSEGKRPTTYTLYQRGRRRSNWRGSSSVRGSRTQSSGSNGAQHGRQQRRSTSRQPAARERRGRKEGERNPLMIVRAQQSVQREVSEAKFVARHVERCVSTSSCRCIEDDMGMSDQEALDEMQRTAQSDRTNSFGNPSQGTKIKQLFSITGQSQSQRASKKEPW